MLREILEVSSLRENLAKLAKFYDKIYKTFRNIKQF